MSMLRYLYRKPSSQRVCPGCGRVIDRNITLHEGEPWHHGCLMKAKRRRHLCLSCGAELSDLELSSFNFNGETKRSCGFCGSTNLKGLHGVRSRGDEASSEVGGV